MRYIGATFVAGSRILNVGAGSGRDAAFLSAQGFDAYGVEPSLGLRKAAVNAYPELANRVGCYRAGVLVCGQKRLAEGPLAGDSALRKVFVQRDGP